MKCRDKWCYNLTKKSKKLSCIKNKSNGKQVSLYKSCTKSCNNITNVPPKNIPTGSDLPSQSPPTNPTDVLRLSRLSYSSMSRYHHNIVVLARHFNMETPMEKLNLVSVEYCLESISLNFSHLNNAKDSRFPRDRAHGDTFKVLMCCGDLIVPHVTLCFIPPFPTILPDISIPFVELITQGENEAG